MTAALAASWCNRSIGTFMSPPFKWTWDTSHTVQYVYSLAWHEVVPHLVHAMRLARDAHPGQTGFDILDGDVYAFGVAQAGTLPLLRLAFPGAQMFGFDSFRGLPLEDHAASAERGWGEGKFQPRISPSALTARSSVQGGRTTLIQGFFNESLTTTLVHKHAMRAALFVDIDCDLHSSTFSALEWMLSNELLRVGSLVAYDDFWTIPCHRFHVNRRTVSPLEVGEGLAHQELTVRHGVIFRCVAGPCKVPPSAAECHVNQNWAPVFMVVGFARGGVTGLSFSQEAQVQWMQTSRVCRRVGAALGRK